MPARLVARLSRMAARVGRSNRVMVRFYVKILRNPSRNCGSKPKKGVVRVDGKARTKEPVRIGCAW